MTSAGVLALLLALGAGGPRLESASAQAPLPTLVGGGEALLELRVVDGRVAAARRLRGEDALLDRLEADAKGWRFEAQAPALVLAAAVYRPAQLLLETPLAAGPTRAEASASLPLPVSMPPPAYPPQSLGDAAVVVEAQVDESGRVAEARVVGGAPGFSEVALEAARTWRFRPAHRDGAPIASTACLVLAFRQPATPRERP